MRQQTIRWRRARCLFLYWRDGRLFLHNFAKRLTVSGKPITCEVLDFFGEWRTHREAIAHFAEYKPSSVRSAVFDLEKHGLLLPKNSPEAMQDMRIAKEWSAWLPEGSFHFSTKDAAYVDRSNWSLDRLKAVMPRTPQPKFVKTVKGAEKVLLPARTSVDSEFTRVLMARKTHRRFSKQKLPLGKHIDDFPIKSSSLRRYRNCSLWFGALPVISILPDSVNYFTKPVHRAGRGTPAKCI